MRSGGRGQGAVGHCNRIFHPVNQGDVSQKEALVIYHLQSFNKPLLCFVQRTQVIPHTTKCYKSKKLEIEK